MVEAKTCHSANCNRPVIGICNGFEGPCGRPFCEEHSTKSLCSACNEKFIKTASGEVVEEAMAAMYNEFSDQWCQVVFHYLPHHSPRTGF